MIPGELVKRRRQMGLSQESLARLLGVSANTVARWEQGRLPVPPYLKLALQGLDVEVRQAPDLVAERSARMERRMRTEMDTGRMLSEDEHDAMDAKKEPPAS